MKTLLVFVGLAFGLSAFASDKTCTGAAGNFDSAGVVLELRMHPGSIVLKSNDGSFAGTYKTNGGKNVIDGKTYLLYEGEDDGYFNEISVDQNLLSPNTTGLLKIHSINEGSVDTEFTCVD
ncbi:MAG: hypothetical protein ACXVA9_07015 [Bdellovibrionales bacterium]